MLIGTHQISGIQRGQQRRGTASPKGTGRADRIRSCQTPSSVVLFYSFGVGVRAPSLELDAPWIGSSVLLECLFAGHRETGRFALEFHRRLDPQFVGIG